MKKYKGFSLIEVLMLFAALAVILAVSAPLVTKKAKTVPTKLPHGFYQCYRDDSGALHEEWYNSFRQISSKTVSACTFTPPEHVNMFKITLIGAGTGGVSFANVFETMQTSEAQYSLGGQYTGKNYLVDISNDIDILSKIFGGTELQLCTDTSPSGGSGQGEKWRFFDAYRWQCGEDVRDEDKADYYSQYGYTVVEEPTQPNEKRPDSCPSEDEDIQALCDEWAEYDSALADYNTAISDAKQTISSSWYNYDADKIYADFAQACVTLGKKLPYAYVPSNGDYDTELTSEGGDGGSGGKSLGTYKINPKGSMSLDEYKKYLSAVQDSYDEAVKSIACASGSKNNCVTTNAKVANGTSITDYRIGYSSTGYQSNRKYATDAQGGYGIRFKNPLYGTEEWLAATFGVATAGGYGEHTGDGYNSPYAKGHGTSGDNTENIGGCSQSSTVYGILTTYRRIKEITLGGAGLAGSVENITARDLGTKPCYIYIGQGSPPHQIGKRVTNSVQPYVNTVLSCSGGKYTAAGALETNATETQTYTPDDDQEGEKIHAPKDAPTANYKYPNLWLGQIANPSINFGQGGAGTSLKDTCTAKYGYMWYGSNREANLGRTGDYGRACTKEDYTAVDGNSSSSPSAGYGASGAVLIRW